ncbi:MAG: glucokinase [Campylobacterota bacterium]|nr:glucokinase [Campylobacterota bacterium]
MRVLAGDIGGTKTSLAIFEVNGSKLEMIAQEKYPSSNYNSLDTIVEKFLATQENIPRWASFGIAGPVRDGIVKTTNLPWIIDAQKMADKIGFKKVWLLNDLEANAWGISALQERDFFVINKGKPNDKGNAAIISAGTGLGQAGLYCSGEELHPFASEGGHSDFSPHSELEIALLGFLKKRYAKESHVSWERLVSGMGIENIYDFFCEYHKVETPKWLAKEINSGDKAAAISKAAANNSCLTCNETFKLFIHLFGAEAGNHALKIMATAGVYIGGGIAPKNLQQFKNSSFMDSFCNKGRMREILQDIPVKIILNQQTALYGPAIFAGKKINS